MTIDRTASQGTAAGWRPHRIRVGVRVRILATVLTLTALGMAVAGVAFLLFERRQLLGHIDAELGTEAERFRVQAHAAARMSGADVGSILRGAVARPLPVDEVVLGVLDGRPAFIASGPRPFAIETERELVSTVVAMPAGQPVRLHQVATSVGLVRFVAVQVQVDGEPELGVYVVAEALGPAQARLAASARTYAALSGTSLVFVAAGCWTVVGRLLRPLRLLRVAAERISHTDLAWRIAGTSGRDDVTELTRTVNAMLDRLQSAFDTQQRFLDDAGHELRTPLTIIRGHLEVLDPTDPAEVHSTRELLVDEVDRMARLVNDLIVLTQAGRPDFVRFGPVDLDQLLQTVLGKAEALADREWLLDSRVGAIALADEQRLTQAMLQLADNAARHTVRGDVIAVGGALSRSGVLLWTRDTGPGVAPEDAARIFERFGRAGSQRGHDGSGLGLSIVSSIAAAHHGSVSLEPQNPRGACFTLRLPLTVLARADHLPPGPPAGSRGMVAASAQRRSGA